MLKAIFDLLAPRTCCICGLRLDLAEYVICTPCFINLPQTGFADNLYENDMAKTFWGRVKNFEKAFALVYHQAHADSAHPVYQLKYRGKPDIGIDYGLLIGKMLAEKGFFDDIDILLPVPLAKKRKLERGYNQSEMIALGLHDISKLPIYNNVVRRTSFESSQTQKDRQDRAENVENAFELVDGSNIHGKHVLIVDDVVTTGATVCAIAKQLQRVADVHISVVSIGFAGQWGCDKKKEETEHTK